MASAVTRLKNVTYLGTDDEPQPQPVSLQKCGLRNVYVNSGLHVSWISCDGKVFAAGGGDKHMTLYDVLTGD
eukprot:COSAG01_NODE_23124_length_827_cov_3.192308_1_plen_71_part_01